VLIFYVLLFGVVYLAWCNFAMNPTRESIKFCENLGKSATETLAIITQAFGEGSWTMHLKFNLTETVKCRKVKSMLVIFLRQGDCSQRIRSGRPNSKFRILLWRSMATAWKCAETSPGTRRQKIGSCITTTDRLTLPFSKENFWRKTIWLSSTTYPTFLCFSDWR
jgi:hypothetical protein